MNAQTQVTADPVVELERALAKALPELEGAKKNSENAAFKNGGKASKYADLGAVIDAIRPIAEHGIWYRQVLHESKEGVEIETLYTGHGATISAGTLFMPADKRNAQGYGSALTYARRYALQTAFGLSTEDDDGNAGSVQPKDAPRVDKMPDAEWAKLSSLLSATNANVPAMLRHLQISVPNNDLTQLNQVQYGRVIDALNDKLADMSKTKEPA